jgi:MscS family membrane protein
VTRIADWLNALEAYTGLDGGSRVVLQLFLLVLAVALVNFALGIVLRRLHHRLQRTKTLWDDAVIEAIRPPLYWLVWVVGVSFAADVFRHELQHPAAFFGLVDPARQVGVIGLVTWALLRLVGRIEANLLRLREERGEPLDRTTVDAVGKLVRLSIAITAGLVALQQLGFSVSGVLAFGGVGGIAVGFAARDLLANFFGGMTVYMDRPFGVGDWIRSPDRNIEGVVEKIGWRQTRIRTFDKRPLYVPNSTFNSIAVENPSRMSNRRIYETVGIRYDDAAQLEAIVADVRALLESDPDIDSNQTLIVNFDRFGPSSLDFFIYAFTKTTQWVEYHAVKQKVLFAVLGIIRRHGAEVAFPTSTLHIPDGVRLWGEEGAAENRSAGGESRSL